MRTLAKTMMVTITIALFLHNIGWLAPALGALTIIALICVPYGLLTNLFSPANGHHNNQNNDYSE